MLTFQELVDAFIASRDWPDSALGRIRFWTDELGSYPLDTITEDDVDDAIARLVARGKMRCIRRQKPTPTGEPLKGSTVNRYITEIQSIFKFARRQRVMPRSWTPPTKGIEKAPEPSDPNRFLSADEVDRLIKAAKVTDTHWKKLPAFIRVLFDTGLRSCNVVNLRWKDVDMVERTATVAVTKNGAPHVAALSARCVAALIALPGHKAPDALIFSNKYGGPYHFKKAFRKAAALARLPHAHPHLLRHGCGATLAAAGMNQAAIMLHMGHKSLGASARYTHLTIDQRRAVADAVFA